MIFSCAESVRATSRTTRQLDTTLDLLKTTTRTIKLRIKLGDSLTGIVLSLQQPDRLPTRGTVPLVHTHW
ncbi:hypothetical protein [Streptomyces sp. NPDC057686]|uniref:hypothetical protein n=1 Tax=Streptomyces sp. NPDC057686 TaxID=3346212 RepID=UPI003689D9EE